MRCLRAGFLLGLVLAVAAGPARAEHKFYAVLTGEQEFPPRETTASGYATFTLNDDQTALTYQAFIYGLDVTGTQTPDIASDNLVNAHIHVGAPPGANAGVRWGFFGTPFNDNNPNDEVVIPFTGRAGGIFSGKWDALEGNNTTLAAQLPGIFAGLAYINFHTVQFAGGEIRGQIVPTPEPASLTLLSVGAMLIGYRRLRQRKAV